MPTPTDELEWVARVAVRQAHNAGMLDVHRLSAMVAGEVLVFATLQAVYHREVGQIGTMNEYLDAAHAYAMESGACGMQDPHNMERVMQAVQDVGEPEERPAMKLTGGALTPEELEALERGEL